VALLDRNTSRKYKLLHTRWDTTLFFTYHSANLDFATCAGQPGLSLIISTRQIIGLIRRAVLGTLQDNMRCGLFLSAKPLMKPDPACTYWSGTIWHTHKSGFVWSMLALGGKWHRAGTDVSHEIAVSGIAFPHSVCSKFGRPSVQCRCRWNRAVLAHAQMGILILATAALHRVNWWGWSWTGVLLLSAAFKRQRGSFAAKLSRLDVCRHVVRWCRAGAFSRNSQCVVDRRLTMGSAQGLQTNVSAVGLFANNIGKVTNCDVTEYN